MSWIGGVAMFVAVAFAYALGCWVGSRDAYRKVTKKLDPPSL